MASIFSSFAGAVDIGDWHGCIKLLSDEIAAASGDLEKISFLLNRGYCHAKLLLHRKALKVRSGRV